MRKKIVIWGLLTVRHSHRYIHSGFYKNFKSLGYEVAWVDDRQRNQTILEGNNIVIAVNVAAKHLKNYKNNFYVTHNIDSNEFVDAENVLRLQVRTNESTGKLLDSSVALFDENTNTLFQPWGVPESEKLWLSPARKVGSVEHWIGAVWNNELNQGNKEIIKEFRSLLQNYDIRFRRIGGTRWITNHGISSRHAFSLINKSPLGTAVVGEWQKSQGYIPCRIFKNVASGSIPSSNSDFSLIFPETGVFYDDLPQTLNRLLDMSPGEKRERVGNAQEQLKMYTYRANIERIFGLV